MQVCLRTSYARCLNFTARSTTGTMLPRRLITPRTQSGILGTWVTTSYSIISFTFSKDTAKVSEPITNVRYWLRLDVAPNITSSFLLIVILGRLLESDEIVFNCRSVRL